MAGIRDLFGLYYWLNNEKLPLLAATLTAPEETPEQPSINGYQPEPVVAKPGTANGSLVQTE